jgi:hypothetical protein
MRYVKHNNEGTPLRHATEDRRRPSCIPQDQNEGRESIKPSEVTYERQEKVFVKYPDVFSLLSRLLFEVFLQLLFSSLEFYSGLHPIQVHNQRQNNRGSNGPFLAASPIISRLLTMARFIVSSPEKFSAEIPSVLFIRNCVSSRMWRRYSSGELGIFDLFQNIRSDIWTQRF